MVRQTKKIRKMRGGACETIPDFAEQCGNKKAYNGKTFNALNAGDQKYSLVIKTYIGDQFCLDIREVIKEIKDGFDHYMLGAIQELEPIYFFGRYRASLVEKERECLGTTVIQEAFEKRKQSLFPPGSAGLNKEIKDFFIAVAYFVRLALVIHPAEENIRARLGRGWSTIYSKTSDYKDLSKERTLDLKIIKTDSKKGILLQHNPFCCSEPPHESQKMVETGAMTQAQLDNDTKLFTNYSLAFSARVQPESVGVDMKEWEPEKFRGRIRGPDDVRIILDGDITNLKALTFFLILKTFTEAMSGATLDEKVQRANDIFLKFQAQDRPIRNQTVFQIARCFMVGGECMRVRTMDLALFLDEIFSMFPEIPELNPSAVLDFSNIPAKYMPSFTEPNRSWSSTPEDWDLLQKYLEKNPVEVDEVAIDDPVTLAARAEVQMRLAEQMRANQASQNAERARIQANFNEKQAAFNAAYNAIRTAVATRENQTINKKIFNSITNNDIFNIRYAEKNNANQTAWERRQKVDENLVKQANTANIRLAAARNAKRKSNQTRQTAALRSAARAAGAGNEANEGGGRRKKSKTRKHKQKRR